ncbi:ABC transporter permease subunit [Myroides sp. LJL116]
MKAICLQEIRSFLSGITAYLVLVVFLMVTGLLLWVLPGSFNILENGFGDLSDLFLLAPLVFIFLIPSITMASFSSEIKQGTIELLLTKPIGIWSIVLGKFLGVFILVILAIIPTTAYIWVISQYLQVDHSLDTATLLGSYLGLFFLAGAYCAIGVFCSTLSSNQIVCFLLGVLLCAFMYIGIEQIALLSGSLSIEQLGVEYHFKSISKGVIDTRDLLYFSSLTILFLAMSVFKVNMLRK